MKIRYDVLHDGANHDRTVSADSTTACTQSPQSTASKRSAAACKAKRMRGCQIGIHGSEVPNGTIGSSSGGGCVCVCDASGDALNDR